MRILVVGGTGFIGRHVVARLVTGGHAVAILSRGRTVADMPSGVSHIVGDRAKVSDCLSEFRSFKPDVVLDMIPHNAKDAETLIGVIRGYVPRLVAVSSQDVYRAYGLLIGTESGDLEPVPVTERSRLRERLYPYRAEGPRSDGDPDAWMDDYDKIPAEQAVMGCTDLAGTVLRLPMVYGPGDGQHRTYRYLRRMDDGRRVILISERLANWRWTRGYVEDVVAAISLVVTDTRASGRIYNVGQRKALTMAEWVRAIAQAAGWGGRIETLPDDRVPEHLKVRMRTEQDLVADCSLIRAELGCSEVVPFEEGLSRTVAWERANPPEQQRAYEIEYQSEDRVLESHGH